MRKTKNILFKVGTSLLLVLTATGAWAGSFADTYGFSAQGIALGNAMTARVNDWSSVYYNVAGLGRTVHLKKAAPAATGDSGDGVALRKREDGSADTGSERAYINDLSFSYFRTMPSLKLDIAQRYSTKSDGTRVNYPTYGDNIDPYGFAIVGLAVDMNIICKLPSIVSSARIGLGAGLNDDLSAIKVNDTSPQSHNFMRYGREVQRATVFGGAGFGFLNDAFGFGGGVNVSFSGEGAVMIEGVNMQPEAQTPQGQSKMDLSVSPAIIAGMYFSPGQLLPVLKGLDLGASFRQESYMEIYPFKTTALAMDESVGMTMILAIMDYYTPHIFTGGISYTLWKLTVSADIEYHMWSKFKVNAANNANYANLPRMKDILVYRLGCEFKVVESFSVMGGAYYQPSFIPKNATTGIFNYMDNDKYVGSVGIRWALPRVGGMGGPVEITAAYQFQYLADRAVNKVYAADATDNDKTMNPSYSYGGTNQSAIVGLCLKL